MTTAKPPSPPSILDRMATIQRLVEAANAHDLDGIVSCFAESYVLESPLHPARSFRGGDQVRRNWNQILAAVPDIRVQLLRSATDHDDGSVWTEWEMAGTRRDGSPHLVRGVFIFGVAEGVVCRGRMFLEPVDDSAVTMDESIRAQVEGDR
jgi:ketosteroid isomerase-like protein